MRKIVLSCLLAATLMAPLWAQAPADPPQPNQISYSAAELQQFPTYTRDSYRAKFGAAAPVCDPQRQLKTWFDRTVDTARPEDFKIYFTVQDAKVRQMVMTNLEASTVNLPGRDSYPPYYPAPTQARIFNLVTGDEIGTLGVDAISTREQAQRFAVLFGGSFTEELSGFDIGYRFPANESRRVWVVYDAAGHKYYAGTLLYQENAAGVGAPGAWSITNGAWKWTAAPVPDCAGNPERPVPVRALLPNERLTADLFGVAIVTRTDLQQKQDESTGRFTDADRQLLRAIAATLGIDPSGNSIWFHSASTVPWPAEAVSGTSK